MMGNMGGMMWGMGLFWLLVDHRARIGSGGPREIPLLQRLSPCSKSPHLTWVHSAPDSPDSPDQPWAAPSACASARFLRSFSDWRSSSIIPSGPGDKLPRRLHGLL
jgi:hypothetical protein